MRALRRLLVWGGFLPEPEPRFVVEVPYGTVTTNAWGAAYLVREMKRSGIAVTVTRVPDQ